MACRSYESRAEIDWDKPARGATGNHRAIPVRPTAVATTASYRSVAERTARFQVLRLLGAGPKILSA